MPKMAKTCTTINMKLVDLHFSDICNKNHTNPTFTGGGMQETLKMCVDLTPFHKNGISNSIHNQNGWNKSQNILGMKIYNYACMLHNKATRSNANGPQK